MPIRSLVMGCALGLLLGACAVTREGTLTRLPSGATVPVSVSIREDVATVTGTDPATGERLEGIFHTSAGERTTGPRGVLGPSPALGGGAVSPGVPPPPATDRRSTIDMVGRLEGDKGTSARCVLQIERGLRVKGSGVCRGEEGDDQSPTFRLRF